MKKSVSLFWIAMLLGYTGRVNAQALQINEQEYFETPGLNVMVYHDYYPIGFQSGITIIQNGERVAANGDIRLYPDARPFPGHGSRVVARTEGEISVNVVYADSLRQKYTDFRFPYPDINIVSTVRVKAEGQAFRIIVDLAEPLPERWAGRIGFSLDLFPGQYFDRPYYMDSTPGIFPRQLNGPVHYTATEQIAVEPLATGRRLVVLPDSEDEMITFESLTGNLELIDGRSSRNNGWFVLRSFLPAGVTKNAIEWLVKPAIRKNYRYAPVIQVSQVGYLPAQRKVAVIEIDSRDEPDGDVSVLRLNETGGMETVRKVKPTSWGKFLRYNYAQVDFTEISRPGIYKLQYKNVTTHAFQIHPELLKRHVWQPTLEYFLPVQMCHMRINDRLKVWHGLCHDDDALMAPVSHIHFDGYRQGPSTLTKYKPRDPVAGLNVGGWHDAGDYDLRVESQANTMRLLAQCWELFHPTLDETTVDQKSKLVEMHRPDGIPDVLQQVEHGALTIIAGYKSLGRLYRGIIAQHPRQYSLLGDGSTMTDNLFFDARLKEGERTADHSAVNNDRLVFTEENPSRELDVAACLANASRVLKGYNDALANDCLNAARNLWEGHLASGHVGLIDAAAELYLTTGDKRFLDYVLKQRKQIFDNIQRTGPAIARLSTKITDKKFMRDIQKPLQSYADKVKAEMGETPYGVPYKPDIWGAGWIIQRFGVNQYFLHRAFPEMFTADAPLNALNFVLGVHPGSNTASFASGVGANSLLVAYGFNRDEWSYIPGGVASGTALIRPDLPELKVWPYLWQQSEYVMGGGEMNYLFLVLATDEMLGGRR